MYTTEVIKIIWNNQYRHIFSQKYKLQNIVAYHKQHNFAAIKHHLKFAFVTNNNSQALTLKTQLYE